MKDYKNKYVLPVTMAVRKKTVMPAVVYGSVFMTLVYSALYTIGGYPV